MRRERTDHWGWVSGATRRSAYGCGRGSDLPRQLLHRPKGQHPPMIGHPNFELIRHDVTDPIRLEVDRTAFSLPCSPIHYQTNPIKTAKTSFLGTHNMLGLARRVKARFLLASTSEVYGDPEVHPQPETYRGRVSTTGVRSCYDEGKRIAETLCFDYNRMHDTEVRVMRIFNTYGPRMLPNDGRVISNFIVQALRGKALTIYGDGSQTRSLLCRRSHRRHDSPHE